MRRADWIFMSVLLVGTIAFQMFLNWPKETPPKVSEGMEVLAELKGHDLHVPLDKLQKVVITLEGKTALTLWNPEAEGSPATLLNGVPIDMTTGTDKLSITTR